MIFILFFLILLLHYLPILELLNREMGALHGSNVLSWPCAMLCLCCSSNPQDKTGLDLLRGIPYVKLNEEIPLTLNSTVKEPLYLEMT